MKMKIRLVLPFAAATFAAAAGEVSLKSLLDEMCDRDAVTRMPEPSYRMRLWSSHDRASVEPGRPGWYANRDYDNFVRTETNAAGRVERVLVDAEGPGALVRAWFAGHGHWGATLRFYVDGAEKPEVEGLLQELVGGDRLCGAPLSQGLAPTTEPERRGINLYLPVPYAKRLKVTVELLKELPAYFYYNFETRTYAAGTQVRSFTREELAAARPEIARASAELLRTDAPVAGETRTFDGELAPGEKREVRFDGPGAIRLVRMKSLSPKEYATQWWGAEKPQLRGLEIELAFDGRSALKMPAGAFFNTGYWCVLPHETRFTRVAADGVMEARWVMPFRQGCTLRVTNRSTLPAVLSRTAIVRGDYAWDARSLYFGATFTPRRRVPTRIGGEAHDLTFDELRGRGRVVGTGIVVDDASREWWGEGDEKVWVDGEASPSYIGTGTEDHFGYAWCRHEVFSHPFLTQPCGEGNGDGVAKGGQSVNFRARSLDSIPFGRSIRYALELWHWADTLVDYDSASYHYTAPRSDQR